MIDIDIVADLDVSKAILSEILVVSENRKMLEESGLGSEDIWFLYPIAGGLGGIRGVVFNNRGIYTLSMVRTIFRGITIKYLKQLTHRETAYVRCAFDSRKWTFSCFVIELGEGGKEPRIRLTFKAKGKDGESSGDDICKYSKQQITTLADLLSMLRGSRNDPAVRDNDSEVFSKILGIISTIGTVPGDSGDLGILYSAMGEAFLNVLTNGERHVVWDSFTIKMDHALCEVVRRLFEVFQKAVESRGTSKQMEHAIDGLFWLMDVVEARQILWLTLCKGCAGIASGPISADNICGRLKDCWEAAIDQKSQGKCLSLGKILDPGQIGKDLGTMRSGNLPTKGFYATQAWAAIAKELNIVLGMLPKAVMCDGTPKDKSATAPSSEGSNTNGDPALLAEYHSIFGRALNLVEAAIIDAWHQTVEKQENIDIDPSATVGKKRIYTYPCIPETKLRNAISSYGSSHDDSLIIGLLDETVWGSAKEGVLFTSTGVYWSTGFGHGSIRYAELPTQTLSCESGLVKKHIILNQGQRIEMVNLRNKESLEAIYRFLLIAANCCGPEADKVIASRISGNADIQVDTISLRRYESVYGRRLSHMEATTIDLWHRVIGDMDPTCNIYTYPDIPQRRLANATSSYARLQADTLIIGLLDETVWGSGKLGVLFTSTEVQWKIDGACGSGSVLYGCLLPSQIYLRREGNSLVVLGCGEQLKLHCRKKLSVALYDFLSTAARWHRLG